MPCYYPLQGYRSQTVNPTGKRSIVFNVNQGFREFPVELPCGQCIGCRLEKSRQWAIRCVHEASLYEDNCFITLTYDDTHLPKDGSLSVEHFQKFMKRLRFNNSEKTIRFFHCGEYGENFGRPHYHACLFNFDFKDKKLHKVINENPIYTSEELQELWPFGFSTIGEVTFESAAYVARYVTKKVTGQKALEHYNQINKQTGEILEERRPEYVTMSRRPGIGKSWFEKYAGDVYPGDFVVLKGKKLKPPKYYNSQYEILNAQEYQQIKDRRIQAAKQHSNNNTFPRLRVREFIQNYKIKLLKRSFEDG